MSVLSPRQAVSPSEAVVARIANTEGVEATELTPLYDAIDPDALDALVASADRDETPLEIEFTYHGYDVTVTTEGVVHIDEDKSPFLTDV